MTTTTKYTLWAVLHDPQAGSTPYGVDEFANRWGFRRRALAALATFDTYEEALAAWTRADARRQSRQTVATVKDLGPSPFRLHDRDRYVTGRTLEVDYLAVRSTDDAEWERRYPKVPAGRLTALLARLGGRATVRIYGSDYTGTVVREGRLSVDVMFRLQSGETKTKAFSILPASPFDRGVQRATA